MVRILLKHKAHIGVLGEINANEIGYISLLGGESLGSLILEPVDVKTQPKTLSLNQMSYILRHAAAAGDEATISAARLLID